MYTNRQTHNMDLNKLKDVLLPGAAILTAVILKNGGKQFADSVGVPLFANSNRVGMALFVAGWIGLVVATGSLADLRANMMGASMKSVLVALSSAAILGAVVGMTKGKAMAQPPSWVKVLAIVFAVAWLALGHGMGSGGSRLAMRLGMAAGVCTIVSMLYLLPKQRDIGIVDGPGMPLFTIAWFLLAGAHAIA